MKWKLAGLLVSASSILILRLLLGQTVEGLFALSRVAAELGLFVF